jgi:large subunit ribosomal protein L3
MNIGILGTKLGMTQIFDESGLAIPVTIIKAGPCLITQIKTLDTDGYSAVQIGYSEIQS